jgi:hypothetical protein
MAGHLELLLSSIQHLSSSYQEEQHRTVPCKKPVDLTQANSLAILSVFRTWNSLTVYLVFPTASDFVSYGMKRDYGTNGITEETENL